MNKEVLKKMIKQVIIENREKSVLLFEAAQPKYDRLMNILEGRSDVETVGIMSGQNPMAQSISSEKNVELKGQLESRLKKMGLKYERIGGIFGGLIEKSVVIMNVDQHTMDILCREFKQWGFVFGQKHMMNATQDFMAFTMYAIDYDEPMGWRKDPYSKSTGFVIKHEELQGADAADNVSFDPTSKKKFGMELYEE